MTNEIDLFSSERNITGSITIHLSSRKTWFQTMLYSKLKRETQCKRIPISKAPSVYIAMNTESYYQQFNASETYYRETKFREETKEEIEKENENGMKKSEEEKYIRALCQM